MWLAGCTVALAGECIVVALRSGSGGAEPTLGGDLLILLAAVLAGAGYVSGARLAAAGYAFIGSLVVAPVAVGGFGFGGWAGGDASSWRAVLYLAVVTSILGYIAWYWALARGGVTRIAPIQFLQPLSGLVLAAVFLEERLTVPLGLGAVVVLAGVAIAQRAGRGPAIPQTGVPHAAARATASRR
jgi:drug/metabolite transporter (DMT)-like permease